MITMITPRPRIVRLLYAVKPDDIETRWVKLDWHCPSCHKMRGMPETTHVYRGFDKYEYQTWNNPCGHKEQMDLLIIEAENNGYNEWQQKSKRVYKFNLTKHSKINRIESTK